MGICYELYNFTEKEYTNLGRYAIETKFWVNSPLSNIFIYATRYYWFHSDDVRLIADTGDDYFDLRDVFKDVTDELVKEYNEYADSNEERYHDGTIPKVLAIEEYQPKQQKIKNVNEVEK